MQQFNTNESKELEKAAEGLMPCLAHLAMFKKTREEFAAEFHGMREVLREQMGFSLVVETRGELAEIAHVITDLKCSDKMLQTLVKVIGNNLRNVKFERLQCSPSVGIDL